MSNVLIFLGSAIMLGWVILGVALYSQYHDEIPNRKKKWLFRLLCGPIVWFAISVGCIFDVLGFIDGVISSFITWIRKP